MNHFKYGGIVTLLFLWGLSTVCSQPQILKSLKKLTPSETFVTTNWNSNNGLPQNTVNRICQDKNGIIWMATYGGLVRFDGTKFKTFSVKNHPELSSDRIYNIYADSKNQLWISSELGKILVYDGRKFHDLTYKFRSNFNVVNNFAEDSRGNIYIKTDSTLYYYLNGKASTVKFPRENKLIDNLMLYETAPFLRNDSLFVSSYGTLSLVYNGKVVKTILTNKNTYLNYSLNINKAGYWYISGNTLYFSKTFEGLPSAKPLFQNISFSRVYVTDSAVLASSLNGGIHKINNDFTVETLFPLNQIPASYRTTFFIDSENSWWIGTELNGVYYIKKKFLYTLNKSHGLEETNTYPIFKSSTGSIWVGQNPGISKIEKGKVINVSKGIFAAPPVVWGITEDKEKNIWLASNGGGILKVSGSKFESLTPKLQKEAGLHFFSIYKDSKDRIWTGSIGRLTKYENNKFSFYSPLDNKKNIYRNILEDKDGSLWLASDMGLIHYANNKFKLIDSINAKSARALYLDRKNRLWIGTYGNGIRVKINNKFYSLRFKDGLYSDIVSAIVEDFKGNFWFTCNNGIFRIMETELDDYLDGKKTTVTSFHYGSEEGLKNTEFNGGCQPSWMRDDQGNLWFPSFSGPVIVDIDALKNVNLQPIVLIDNLIYKESTYYPGDKISLPSDYTSFTVNLISPFYTSQSNMRFKYRLNRNSEEWTDIGNKREIVFQKLPYGKYELQVIASDSYGNWARKPASIKFIVESVFHETPLFFALISLILITIFFLFFYLRLKHAHKQQEQLELIVHERTQKLQEAKEKAELAAEKEKVLRSKAEEENRQKIELLRIVSHDLKNPVFAVQGFAEMLLEDGVLNDTDKNVALMIQEAGERLKELITQLLAFSRFEGGKFNVDKTNLNVAEQIAKIVERQRVQAEKKNQNLFAHIPPDKILISADQVLFEQIFENLISNAIKYSPAGKNITVSVAEESDKAFISVKDEGQGFSEADKANLYKPFVRLSATPTAGESSSGLGLTIVRKFVEVNDGTINLISKKNEGAEFIVEFNSLRN